MDLTLASEATVTLAPVKDGLLTLTVQPSLSPKCEITMTETEVEGLQKMLGVARAKMRGERARG